MNPDAICSCGSGKQFKLCCGKSSAMISLKAASTWFLIGILVSGITAIAWFMPDQDSDTPAANTPLTNNAPQTVLGLGSNLNLNNPQPWQYDPILDRHWHAAGNHWDTGKPPASATNPLLSQPLANQPNLGSRPIPNISNPQPWQYDPVTDQHYVPDHQHWHSGRPPNNPG